MRILTWNIRHGGGRRIDAILARIATHEPDVAVITEFRCSNGGTQLCDGLARIGLIHRYFLHASERTNSTLIASRYPLERACAMEPGLEKPHMLIEAQVTGIAIMAVYMPLGRAKAPYWEAVVRGARERVALPAIILGDFNTGRHYLDEAGATFTSAAFLDRMDDAGFVDLWRSRNPEAREYTWFSNRGNGFRLDHAFASPALASRVTAISYSHVERTEGVSDHSVLIVDLRSIRADAETTKGLVTRVTNPF